MKSLLYRGSVKDLYQSESGVVFDYSDRYSIFDWGEMPDAIENKGINLAKMHVWTYQYLEQLGIKTHLKGFYQGQPSSQVEVEQFYRYSCQFDSIAKKFCYELPAASLSLWALPLEVVFRFAIFRNSSFFERSQTQGYLEGLGYDSDLAHKTRTELSMLPVTQPFFILPRPVVEYFTKLEPLDRLLRSSEVRDISQLSQSQIDQISESTLKVATLLRSRLAQSQIELWDGKLEWGIDPNSHELILIDAIGPDELRMTFEGVQLSKELLRHYYRKTEWYQLLEKAKKQAQDNQDPNWRSYLAKSCEPPPLSSDWGIRMSKIYEFFGELGVDPSVKLDHALVSQIKEFK